MGMLLYHRRQGDLNYVQPVEEIEVQVEPEVEAVEVVIEEEQPLEPAVEPEKKKRGRPPKKKGDVE